MFKSKKRLILLALLLLIGSVNAVDKGKPYEDGKGDDDTFGVEITDVLLES